MTTTRTLCTALLATAFALTSAGRARAAEPVREAVLNVTATVLSKCSIDAHSLRSAERSNAGLELACATETRPLIETSAPLTVAYGTHQQQFVVTTVQF